MDNGMCSRCLYDNSIPDIRFDKKGECTYCNMHDILSQKYPLQTGEQRLRDIVERIKKQGKNKKYDCVVGVSGGRDSTYLLHFVVNQGLRPLAVHYDNGWNSEIAVSNIKNAISRLKVDLYTVVEDWHEFRDLQLSFLKSSTPDAEIPTDIGLKRALYRGAVKHGIKSVCTGYSFRTEGISPLGWTYMEGKYIKSVQKELGTLKLKSFNNLTLANIFYYVFWKKLRFVYPFVYFDYKQSEAQEIIEGELGWEYYGGHHHENYYTKFFQSYYLPQKFGIDKRKTELSALIRSGQIDKEKALEIIKTPYPYDESLIPYVKKKLGLTDEQFDKIMSAPPKSFLDYSTYYPIIKKLRLPIKILCDLEIFPQVFYLKYLN